MDIKIQQYFLKLPEEKKQIAMQVRDIILSADKKITEAIKWNQLTFTIGRENFAFIYTYPTVAYMNLAFFKATSLSDPKKLFEGTGKGMRHIKLFPKKPIPATQIKDWVKQVAFSVTGK